MDTISNKSKISYAIYKFNNINFLFFFTQMQSQVIVTVFLFAMLTLFSCVACSKEVSTPPLCEPGILEDMPQHIRKVCVALENSNQLSNALNAYIRNEAAGKCGFF